MAEIIGIIQIKVGGKLLQTKEGASLDTGGKESEAVIGWDLYGFKDKFVPSKLSFDVAVTPDFDWKAFNATSNTDVEVIGDNGNTFIIHKAKVTKPANGISTDGFAKYEMMGKPAEPA